MFCSYLKVGKNQGYHCIFLDGYVSKLRKLISGFKTLMRGKTEQASLETEESPLRVNF